MGGAFGVVVAPYPAPVGYCAYTASQVGAGRCGVKAVESHAEFTPVTWGGKTQLPSALHRDVRWTDENTNKSFRMLVQFRVDKWDISSSRPNGAQHCDDGRLVLTLAALSPTFFRKVM